MKRPAAHSLIALTLLSAAGLGAGHASATSMPAWPAAAAGASSMASSASAEDITIPAGTMLSVVLDETIGSDISRVEQPVRGHLSRALLLRGREVLAPGATVGGIVTSAVRSGRVKGRARIGVRFATLEPAGSGDRYTIRTAAIDRLAPATKTQDAEKIGVPAAGGAIIGALVGGGKGAAIGAAAGGGAGTAVVLSTRGKEIRLRKGAVLRVRLTAPLTVKDRG